MELIDRSRGHAFLLMPHAPHHDYFCIQDPDKLYPELPGKGDGARNPCFAWGGSFALARCPCMATPRLKRLLTEWIEKRRRQGIREISLWLSERTPCQCECEACLKDERRQFQKETQACIDAIIAARSKYPDLQGRIFFTFLGSPRRRGQLRLPGHASAGNQGGKSLCPQ